METVESFAKFNILRDDGGRYYLEYRNEIIAHDYDIIYRTDEYFVCVDDIYEATINFDGELVKEEGINWRGHVQ